MKKILNYFVFGAVAVLFSAALASCQKENTAPETPQAIETPQAPEVHVIHVELNAAISDTKSEYDSGTKEVTIENGDQLYVVLTQPDAAGWSAATGTLTYDGTSFKGDITYTGTYGGSDIITDAKDLTATFLPKDYSTVGYLSAEGVATGANAFYAGEKSASVPQLVHLTATIENQAGSAKSPLTLVPQNAVICYSINANKLSAGAHTVSVSDGTTTISGSVTAVADAATTFAVAFPATATSKDYTLRVPAYENVVKSGKTLAAGKVINISVASLPLTFSVDAGKYVQFSQGNLQYKASTNTWRFAGHQYDVVGDSNASISSTYDGWIDLFGWGTSGHVFASGYGSAYQPWSTSDTDTDYGPTDGTSGLTGSFADGDWGVNMGPDWRTLTSAEWTYLMNTRSVTYRYCKAIINSVKGLVIFPDNYTHPTGVTAVDSENTSDAAYTTNNSWSADDWIKMETAGAVFLPAAGYRSGTSVYSVGSVGRYWSSTPSGTRYAYYLFFSASNVRPDFICGRYFGNSVRLVQNQ